MANESVKITNGTVATHTKVLKEVQEVQHREGEVTPDDPLQFRPGYVSLLKSRFANLSVAQPAAASAPVEDPKPMGRTVTSIKPQSNAHNSNALANSVAQPQEIQSSALSVDVRKVPEQTTSNAFRKASSGEQANTDTQVAPSSQHSKHDPGSTASESESGGDARLALSAKSQDSEADQKTDIQNLKRLFEQLGGANGASARSSFEGDQRRANSKPQRRDNASGESLAETTSEMATAVRNRKAGVARDDVPYERALQSSGDCKASANVDSVTGPEVANCDATDSPTPLEPASSHEKKPTETATETEKQLRPEWLPRYCESEPSSASQTRSREQSGTATPSKPPPSYFDVARGAGRANDPIRSAYARFDVLQQMHKRRENDEDDFASLSNEERERKLRQAAQRIQVAGANVHLSKSAFRSDTRRKASLDLTAMAEHDKDTLSVSEEASAMAADRNRRISFNDAAIAITHEYPSEECWNEEGESESDTQECNSADSNANADPHSNADEQQEKDEDDEDDEDDDVTKSRLYALFAKNAAADDAHVLHSNASPLPSYDESVKRSDDCNDACNNDSQLLRNNSVQLRLLDDSSLQTSDNSVVNQTEEVASDCSSFRPSSSPLS